MYKLMHKTYLLIQPGSQLTYWYRLDATGDGAGVGNQTSSPGHQKINLNWSKSLIHKFSIGLRFFGDEQTVEQKYLVVSVV